MLNALLAVLWELEEIYRDTTGHNNARAEIEARGSRHTQ